MLLGAGEYQSDDSGDIGVSNLFDDANNQDKSSTNNSETEKIEAGTSIDNVASREEGNPNSLIKIVIFLLTSNFNTSHYYHCSIKCNLATQKNEQEEIHQGIRCDGCAASPIHGKCYKCLECDDYDLCAQCQSNGIHNQHRMTQRPGIMMIFLLHKYNLM